jgi:transposase
MSGNAIEAEVPAGKLVHVILDNYAAHKHPNVLKWLARHPRFTFHFTPTSASWINAVEGFIAKLTKRRLQRGVFHSLVALQAAINRFLAEANQDPRPFRWTKNAQQRNACVLGRPRCTAISQGKRPALAVVLHGHLLIENRHGLIVDVRTTHASGRAEREAAEAMIQAAARGRRVTLGADKAYDAAEHIARLRAIGVTPHVAQNTSGRRSAIDGRTTRHAGYATSQRRRKRVEEPFGWIKSAAGLRKTRHRGLPRVGWVVTLTAAACNLVRLPKLLARAA